MKVQTGTAGIGFEGEEHAWAVGPLRGPLRFWGGASYRCLPTLLGRVLVWAKHVALVGNRVAVGTDIPTLVSCGHGGPRVRSWT